MKRLTIILLVAAASMTAFGQPPQATQKPTTPVPAKKEKSQLSTQFNTPFTVPASTLTLRTQKVERVGGMSSRPWAQIVGWRPGYSAFPRPELRDPSIPIFWIGRDPRPW